MANISREASRVGSLLSTTNRVEAPFVRVTLGGYSFGVYETRSKQRSSSGVISTIADKYPNYIKDLTVKKINGVVNQYTLAISYPITQDSDPNFFEKLFSKVSATRKISFEYGDSMMPSYIYKDEEAIITNVNTKMNIQSSVIDYTIEAVSASKLSLSGSYNFQSTFAKPSDEIKRVLRDNGKYHLMDVFFGMKGKIDQFIAGDDKKIKINTCTGMSALEYISYLVSCMIPVGSSSESAIKSNVYSITTFDDENGPYFKVQKVQKSSNSLNQLCTYEVDVGYSSANIITQFDIKNNENWSIYYNYNRDINQNDYLTRIDDKGEEKYIYSPLLTNSTFAMTATDSNWWTQVTEYPIQATLSMKGLLRPVVLMQYIKLNVWYYGHKHISSGYYVIKSQTDRIGLSGYTTTLELVRVAPDDNI